MSIVEEHNHVSHGNDEEIEGGGLTAHQVDGLPHAHAQATSIKYKFLHSLKETLFPDDPFREFHRNTHGFILALQYIFPLLDWAPKYKLSDFKSDLVSGITIASLSIPQGIAYAKLANLPPIYGLYSSFVPPLIYSVLGSSRHIAAGPSAILSILVGVLLKGYVDPVANPDLYLQMAFTATFFAGILQASLGILRLGFIMDLLSDATQVGFISGVAIIICSQQFKEMLGLKEFTKKPDIVHVLRAVFKDPGSWEWAPIVIAVCFVSFMLVTKFLSKRRKVFFWLNAAAPMLSVIITTFFVWVTKADERGLRIVGKLPKGLNPASTSKLILHGSAMQNALEAGGVVAAIGLMEAIAVGRTFASAKGYHVDDNKEIIAVGIMNIAGSCTSCYAVTGALARSAVNVSAGCKSAVSNIIMAFFVMIVLLFLLPLFHYTPNVILASIIFANVIGMIDPAAAYAVLKIDIIDFFACIAAFLGVLFISIQVGLVIAVVISLLGMLLHMARPHTALLGQIPHTGIYRDLHQYPEASRMDGISIIRIDAAIYFFGANYIRERVLRWVGSEDSSSNSIQYVILDLGPVITMDVTAIHALQDLHKMLENKKKQLVIVNPANSVLVKLEKSGFVKCLGDDWVFLSVGEAVTKIRIKCGHLDHQNGEEPL